MAVNVGRRAPYMPTIIVVSRRVDCDNDGDDGGEVAGPGGGGAGGGSGPGFSGDVSISWIRLVHSFCPAIDRWTVLVDVAGSGKPNRMRIESGFVELLNGAKNWVF